MSNLSTSQGFDIWEFITCSRCHLPFAPEPGAPPQVPFWLTDCGHVVCNTHLSADQTCVKCNATSIELMPLQRDLEPPMSKWFCSVPHYLDAAAAASKFQQETMASLLRFYKQKCAERGALINRMKGEVAENKTLKKEINALRTENEQLRQQLRYPTRGQPSDMVNCNGKRPMTSIHRSSSPRSVGPSMGPGRLTLPINQQPSGFSFRQESDNNRGTGSNGSVQQYAYVPPQTPLFRGQGLSHTQAGPLRQPPTRSTERQNQGFLPPATPPSLRHAQGQRGTFKPAMAGPAQLSKANTPQAQRPGIRPKMTTAHDRRQMGPPPPLTTVQDQIQEHPRAGFTPAPGSRAFAPTPQTNRFMPSTANGSRFVPQAPSGAPQRFVPAGASDSRQASTSASNRRSGNPWN